MNDYIIKNKATGKEAYRFTADSIMELGHFPFSEYEYSLAPIEIIDNPIHTDITDTYIDVGPFFDRFGSAKMDILTSTDPLIKAILQDVQIRKWVDLKRPDVSYSLDVIASKIPGVTPSIKAAVLATPVNAEENMALKTMFFNEKTL